MPFRRKPKPPVDPPFAPLVAELWLAYEEGVELCREVATAEDIDDDLRKRALTCAVRIAYVCRVTMEAMLNLDLLDHIPADHNAINALGANTRLAQSLTLSAEETEDGPEPGTVLSIGDLDGLPVQYELRGPWLKALERSAAASKDKG